MYSGLSNYPRATPAQIVLVGQVETPLDPLCIMLNGKKYHLMNDSEELLEDCMRSRKARELTMLKHDMMIDRSTLDLEVEQGLWDTATNPRSVKLAALKAEKSKKPPVLRFITINPPPPWNSVNSLAFVEATKRLFKKLSWIPVGSSWVYEQKGDPLKNKATGHHPHCHLLIESKKLPCEIYTELARCLKIDKSCVKVVTKKAAGLKKITEDYMHGQKKDCKMASAGWDGPWRNSLKIEDWYTK